MIYTLTHILPTTSPHHRWGEATGLGCVGRDTGEGIFEKLVETWKSKEVKVRDCGENED